jgi:hypothetical protein
MWHDGYLEQARSDWEVYKLLEDSECATCHALHYLQMTTEKLAKALLLLSGIPFETVRASHRAFTQFLQIASRNREIQEALGMTRPQLRMSIRELLPIAYEIERLAPALAVGGANVEYPWESLPGVTTVPASYNFPVHSTLQLPRGRKLLKLVDIALNQFYRIFA